ncbi:MAG: DNA primase [Oscillospiraceae bacterium]
MALPEGFLSELRSNNDIVDLIGGYVELKRSGRTHSCRCPFHSERTASFHVYPDTQSFFCFGCHAGGDAITFIRMIENLDYLEAVRFLAQRANMAMPEDGDDDNAQLRKRLYEMNRAAGKFFHEQLFSPEGAAGWQYITGRGLSEHTIRHFGLGFAPNDYHKLHMHMRKLGYSDDELVRGALLVRRENSVYDKFRNRVMFPIFDLRGNIIGFGGRALDPNNPAKYLNSDETYVFKKRQNIFALNYAKNSKADYFILCEGYMDVISMHQAGFTSAVATLGTAITAEQARLVGRLGKKEVILSYDSDEAGQAAASRGINLLTEAGIKARVLQMRGAKDPDEFINKFGAEAFEHLITNSGSAIDYELNKLQNGLDLSAPDGRASYLKKAVVFLAQLNNALDRAVYISRTAEIAQVSAGNVESAVDAEIRKRRKRNERNELRELIYPTSRSSDSANLPREEKAENGIITYLFYNQDKLAYIEQRLTTGFATEFGSKVFGFMAGKLRNGETVSLSSFNEEFEPAQMGRISQIIQQYSLYGSDNDILSDNIKTLNDFCESKQEIDAARMSSDDLLEFARRQAEKLKEKDKG